MGPVDEMLDHLLGDVDVGDDSAAQRPDGLDVRGRLPKHQLGVAADRLHPADAVGRLERDDRRLVEHDSLPADVDDGIHRPEVDRHVVRGQAQEAGEEHSGKIVLRSKNKASGRPGRQSPAPRISRRPEPAEPTRILSQSLGARGL
jgi:hypothetical protein